MNKKTICIMVMIMTLTVFSTCLPAFAADAPNVAIIASNNFSAIQGQGNWFYQYKAAGTYHDLLFDAAQKKWYTDTDTGGAAIWETSTHPGSACDTARVWKSDTSGIVQLNSNSNIAKGAIGGDGVTVKIFKNTEQLYIRTLAGDDLTGFNYNIEIEIKKDDKIYFEISTPGGNTQYDATLWNPVITYKQIMVCTVGSNRIMSTKDIKQNDTVLCTLYFTMTNTYDALGYVVIYDDLGRMRKISTLSPTLLIKGESTELNTSVLFDIPAVTYSGWRIEFMILSQPDRYYPIVNSDLLSLE